MDTNFNPRNIKGAEFLPMFFFLPETYVNSCPTLPKMPRNLYKIMDSDELIEIVMSIQFLYEVQEATAALVFPHFGLRGWKEDYTGHHPAWKLSYATDVWQEQIEKVTGWGWARLLNRPDYADVPYFTHEYVDWAMSEAVKNGLTEHNWQAILDVARKMPCHEDFEPRRSNVRKDFMRKWHHSRTKIGQYHHISLEESMADPKHSVHRCAVDLTDIQGDVESNDYWERFKAKLSHKDKEILVMRVNGYTYEEIAEKLSYKNHSGVLKRMKAITAEYEKYAEKQEQELKQIQ